MRKFTVVIVLIISCDLIYVSVNISMKFTNMKL